MWRLCWSKFGLNNMLDILEDLSKKKQFRFFFTLTLSLLSSYTVGGGRRKSIRISVMTQYFFLTQTRKKR